MLGCIFLQEQILYLIIQLLGKAYPCHEAGFFPLVPGLSGSALPGSAPTDSAQFSKVHLHPQGTTQPGLCLEMIKM